MSPDSTVLKVWYPYISLLEMHKIHYYIKGSEKVFT